jgi:hypothetical protein
MEKSDAGLPQYRASMKGLGQEKAKSKSFDEGWNAGFDAGYKAGLQAKEKQDDLQ